MSRTERQAERAVPSPPPSFPQIEGMGPDRFFMTGIQIAEMTQNLAQEMMTFAERRMRAQLTFMEGLPRCTEPQEMVAAQLRFISDASRDYAEEIGLVAQVLRRLGEQAERRQPPSA